MPNCARSVNGVGSGREFFSVRNAIYKYIEAKKPSDALRDGAMEGTMTRRDMLKSLAATPLASLTGVAGEPIVKCPMGLVIHSLWIRSARPLEPRYPSVSDPLSFVGHTAQIGGAGVQTKIGTADAQYVSRLRDAVERHEMYLEGIVGLPKGEGDVARFEAEVLSAKSAGVAVLRTVCLGGRRYETFQHADQFREFTEQSWQSLVLAEAIVARHRVRLAVENHKDWRIDEMLGWLQRLSSEHVGVTLDTGNSIALLEEPHTVVEAFAPWTMTTHFKDMAVAEYQDGFLLSEVPLGDGFLDLPRVVNVLRKARPEVRFNLEMITRDPLRVPCLTEKYWATLGEVRGHELADALARMRRHQCPQPLPEVSKLSHSEQLEAEEANIARSLQYARRLFIG
jgi:sugar phosphate isomerase/epimerase